MVSKQENAGDVGGVMYSSRRAVYAVLAVAALVVAISFLVFAFERQSLVRFGQWPTMITVETKPLPHLVEHTHDAGDSPHDRGHHLSVRSEIFVVPQDIWVRSFELEMVNAPAIALHHMQLLDMEQSSFGCPNFAGKELFVFGQDQMHDNRAELPDGYALFIAKGTQLVLDAAIHNPQPPVGPGGEYENVSVRITLAGETHGTYTPIEYQSLHLDDIGCSNISDAYTFTVPAGVSEFAYTGPQQLPNPEKVTFQYAGKIVYIGGHLHGWQGGKLLRVMKNGTELLTFTTKKSNADPYRFDTPHYQTEIPIAAGDVIAIEAIYDNPSHIPTRGAMGLLGFAFAKDEN